MTVRMRLIHVCIVWCRVVQLVHSWFDVLATLANINDVSKEVGRLLGACSHSHSHTQIHSHVNIPFNLSLMIRGGDNRTKLYLIVCMCATPSPFPPFR